jgi:HD-like signal output (HDOD) protein
VIGAKLLIRWGLPDKISLAVGFHNGTNGYEQTSDRLVAIVQIASALALRLDAEHPAPREQPQYQKEAMSLVELTPEDVPALLEEIKEGLEQVEGLSAVCFDAGI